MFILILIYVCYILGVYKVLSNLDDFNNLRDTGKYLVTNTNALNSPVNAYQYVIVSASGSKQISMPDNSSKVFIRTYYSDNWTPWVEVSYDIPSFYKSYQNLASLANALGVSGINNMKIIPLANITVPANGTYEISNIDCGLYFFRECYDNGFSSFGMYHYSNGVNVISENNNVIISASNTSALVYISTSNYTIILKNNTDSDKIVTGFIVRSAATA